jgi:hypothetical protein
VLDAFRLRDEPLNSNERGKLNKAIKLWKESGGTPEEWSVYVGWYRRIWPNITLTPLALASNRATIRGEAKKLGWIPKPAQVVEASTPYELPGTRPSKEEGRRRIQELKERLKR